MNLYSELFGKEEIITALFTEKLTKFLDKKMKKY